MIILVVLWAYALLQLKIMINKEDWSLIQQNVRMSSAELAQKVEMQAFPNVTVALQFNQKRKALSAEDWAAIKL